MILGYHFLLSTWRTACGNVLVEPGQTLRHDGTILLCKSGLHASVRAIDALRYARGPIVTRVECSGEIQHGDDKIVCSERRVLWGYNAADELRTFARRCALDVIHLWDAPQVVRDYLETGDEELRDAARDAARVAAWAAAWDAGLEAWSAARSALDAALHSALDAAWNAARSAAQAAKLSEYNTALETLLHTGAVERGLTTEVQP